MRSSKTGQDEEIGGMLLRIWSMIGSVMPTLPRMLRLTELHIDCGMMLPTNGSRTTWPLTERIVRGSKIVPKMTCLPSASRTSGCAGLQTDLEASSLRTGWPEQGLPVKFGSSSLEKSPCLNAFVGSEENAVETKSRTRVTSMLLKKKVRLRPL